MTIQVIISAALCGILAAVYHAILIAPGHILSKPRQLIERLVYWTAQKSQYGRLYKVTEWVFHSLYDCSWCLAGQIALFGYIYHGVPNNPFRTIAPADVRAWWQFENNGLDVMGNNNLTSVGSPTYATP